MASDCLVLRSSSTVKITSRSLYLHVLPLGLSVAQNAVFNLLWKNSTVTRWPTGMTLSGSLKSNWPVDQRSQLTYPTHRLQSSFDAAIPASADQHQQTAGSITPSVVSGEARSAPNNKQVIQPSPEPLTVLQLCQLACQSWQEKSQLKFQVLCSVGAASSAVRRATAETTVPNLPGQPKPAYGNLLTACSCV